MFGDRAKIDAMLPVSFSFDKARDPTLPAGTPQEWLPRDASLIGSPAVGSGVDQWTSTTKHGKEQRKQQKRELRKGGLLMSAAPREDAGTLPWSSALAAVPQPQPQGSCVPKLGPRPRVLGACSVEREREQRRLTGLACAGGIVASVERSCVRAYVARSAAKARASGAEWGMRVCFGVCCSAGRGLLKAKVFRFRVFVGRRLRFRKLVLCVGVL